MFKALKYRVVRFCINCPNGIGLMVFGLAASGLWVFFGLGDEVLIGY